VNPRRLGCLVAAWLCLLPLVSRAADVAPPTLLADSTTVERWTLDNGLLVTTRHIPGAKTVAMVLGYRVGSDLDPVGQEGLAQLMAELVMMAPAGSVPGRTADELNRLRPEGWDLQAGPHFTTMTEIAAPGQVAGVLSQLAARLRGVTVTQPVLKTSIESVRGDLAQRFFGPPAQSLYYQVRELGLHTDDQITLRKANAKGIERITVKQAQDRLQKLYVPANAVLSIVGDLDGAQLHALIQSQFGDIRGGTPGPTPTESPLHPYARVIKRTDVSAPIGVIAVISPPVTDPNHHVFYLGVTLLGGLAKDVWKPNAALPTRFRYSLFSDPDLALYFPETEARDQDTDGMGVRFSQIISRLRGSLVGDDVYKRLAESLRWQLGGPLSRTLRDRALNESSVLGTLASTMAARSLWLGETFWQGYLGRLDAEPSGSFDRISGYVEAREHQVRLLFHPGK
jgi:hypothetical protein